MDQQRYDIAIIGSGIGGSILATILSKEGVRVVVIEESQHPKFAIGESMILESSEIFRQLAETYDIPEIAYYSSENFKSLVGSERMGSNAIFLKCTIERIRRKIQAN